MPQYDADAARYVLNESLRLVIENIVPDGTLKTSRTLDNIPKVGIRQTEIKWSAVTEPADVVGELTIADSGLNKAAITLPASLPIGNHRLIHGMQILKTELEQAMAVNDPQLLAAALERKTRDGITQLRRQMNQLVLVGDGTADATNLQVVGMDVITEAPDGTTGSTSYAGIEYSSGDGTDLAKNSAWVSVRSGDATEPLSDTMLLEMEEDFENAEVDFNLVIASPRSARRLKELNLDQREVVAQLSREVGMNLDFTINGRPGIIDNKMPDDGVLFLVNTQDVAFHSYQMSSGIQNDGIWYEVVPMPSANPSLFEFVILCYPQFVAFNRKSIARFEFDATEPAVTRFSNIA
jgi:hypothetical protein